MQKLTKFLPFLGLSLLLAAGSLSAKVYEYTEGNQLNIIANSRASVDLKLDMVRHARHHIHIMSYYWDNNGYPLELMKELNLAHARGVDVRIMTTWLPSLAMDLTGKADRELFKNVDKHNTNATIAFLKLAPVNGHKMIENLHEKIFLVDGEVAILGGRNISDNDFRAKDLEIEFRGPIVNQVQEHFEKMFSFLADLEIKSKCDFANRFNPNEEDSERERKEKYYESCVKKIDATRLPPNSKANLSFYPIQKIYKDGAKARLLTNEVLFSTFESTYFGDDRFLAKDDIIDTVVTTKFSKLRAYNYFVLPTSRYKEYLEKNLKDGNSIDILTNSKKTAASISDNGYVYSLPSIQKLVKLGANVYEWQGNKPAVAGEDQHFYLHEKVMLFDDDHAIIGSHNFGAGSTSVSSEVCVEFFSKTIVKTLIEEFDEEKNNTDISHKVSKAFIENEENANRKKINLLHKILFRNIVREIY